jgi:hypothetical protein
MDDFYNRLSAEAATIDELLSDDFEPLPGQKSDAEKAGARLGAWCRTAASGDWSLFERRLVRDGLSISGVLTRFATVRRRAASPVPAWVTDAMWIEAALSQPARAADLTPGSRPSSTQPFAFEDALLPVVDRASAILLDGCDEAKEVLAESALAGLRGSLLESLSPRRSSNCSLRFARSLDRLPTRRCARPAPGTIASSRTCATAASVACSATSRSCCA